MFEQYVLSRDNGLNIAQSLRRAASPRCRCVLCGDRAGMEAICAPCRADLPWRDKPWRKSFSGIDALEVCFDFGYPIRQLLHRAKYGRDIAVARLLGDLVAARLHESVRAPALPGSAALFPVPAARKRLLTRGYNQAVEIARPVSAMFSIPIDVVSVYKRRGLPPQSTLDAARRWANIRDAFACRRPPRVDVAIVFDDVITTGATVQAMARTLRAAGVGYVSVWALAAVE